MKPNGKQLFLACLLTAFFVAPIRIAAQDRGPSTPEERARAVQTAKSLQADPLAPSVKADGEWIVKWLIQVPDITVEMCSAFMEDVGNLKNEKSSALLSTMLASQAQFVIENPDKAKDHDAIYVAGLEGALEGYESIRKKDAAFHVKQLDELILKRDQGTLPAFVHTTAAKKCKQ
jgi:hypothetical protein